MDKLHRVSDLLKEVRFSIDTVIKRGQENKINRNTVNINLFNTDTKGTEPSVRFTEVSILYR